MMMMMMQGNKYEFRLWIVIMASIYDSSSELSSTLNYSACKLPDYAFTAVTL